MIGHVMLPSLSHPDILDFLTFLDLLLRLLIIEISQRFSTPRKILAIITCSLGVIISNT